MQLGYRFCNNNIFFSLRTLQNSEEADIYTNDENLYLYVTLQTRRVQMFSTSEYGTNTSLTF